MISLGLISLAAIYYWDGKIQIAKNENVIIEELFSGFIFLYFFFYRFSNYAAEKPTNMLRLNFVTIVAFIYLCESMDYDNDSL